MDRSAACSCVVIRRLDSRWSVSDRTPLNLQSLQIFCEVVRQQSFSRGAATFGITQSAASQLVASLEETLGCRLINRKRRPPEPTPEGKIYYEGCHEILQRHRALYTVARVWVPLDTFAA